MNIISQRREQARGVYYVAVVEIKKEIPIEMGKSIAAQMPNSTFGEAGREIAIGPNHSIWPCAEYTRPPPGFFLASSSNRGWASGLTRRWVCVSNTESAHLVVSKGKSSQIAAGTMESAERRG
jgi:hypothetical protein